MTEVDVAEETKRLLRELYEHWRPLCGAEINPNYHLEVETFMVDRFLAKTFPQPYPRDLTELIALLRRTGVTRYETPDLSLTLGPEPYHEEPAKKEPAHDDDLTP